MYNLKSFTFVEMNKVGVELRKIGESSKSIEMASNRIAKYFYNQFQDPDSQKPDFVLSRCFQTIPLKMLPKEIKEIALKKTAGMDLGEDTICLTLLGTDGDKPEWTIRTGSNGHQVIPLLSEEIVKSLPMVSRLSASFGLAVNALIRPDPKILLEHEKKEFNVFFVEKAEGSPFIPAQQWVEENRIQSVIGFGFILPPQSIFAVILFSRVHVESQTAELFKTLALSVKLALLPLTTGSIFESHQKENTQEV